VEATPDVPLETGPVGPYWTIAAFIDGTWNNDVLCGPDGRAYAWLFANARRWLTVLLEEIRRLRALYDALLKREVLNQQVAAEKIGQLEAQLAEAHKRGGRTKQERGELAMDQELYEQIKQFVTDDIYVANRDWIVALVEEVERLRARVKWWQAHSRTMVKTAKRFKDERDEAREWARRMKRERDELAGELVGIAEVLKDNALRELEHDSGWTPEREWDEADQVCLCPNCGSEMDCVRPGEWQCRKCELKEMLEKAYENVFVGVSCPNCGEIVSLKAVDLDILDSGTTLPCPKCGKAIVFELFGEDWRWSDELEKAREEGRAEAHEELAKVKHALETCGIAGIYDAFHSPADAIHQMASYIEELSDKDMLENTEAVK